MKIKTLNIINRVLLVLALINNITAVVYEPELVIISAFILIGLPWFVLVIYYIWAFIWFKTAPTETLAFISLVYNLLMYIPAEFVGVQLFPSINIILFTVMLLSEILIIILENKPLTQPQLRNKLK